MTTPLRKLTLTLNVAGSVGGAAEIAASTTTETSENELIASWPIARGSQKCSLNREEVRKALLLETFPRT